MVNSQNVMNSDTLILKIKRLFAKKQIVNDNGKIPDDAGILTIRGLRYSYYKENEMVVERFLRSFCKDWEFVEISDYRTGEVFETIRMDVMFN